MTDEKDMLRSILNDPFDMSIRLGYADILDEKGASLYAQYIRDQILSDRCSYCGLIHSTCVCTQFYYPQFADFSIKIKNGFPYKVTRSIQNIWYSDIHDGSTQSIICDCEDAIDISKQVMLMPQAPQPWTWPNHAQIRLHFTAYDIAHVLKWGEFPFNFIHNIATRVLFKYDNAFIPTVVQSITPNISHDTPLNYEIDFIVLTGLYSCYCNKNDGIKDRFISKWPITEISGVRTKYINKLRNALGLNQLPEKETHEKTYLHGLSSTLR